jgi:voltage-gated potassium channel
MNEESSGINPKQEHGVVHLHSTSYNLFILVLTLFSLAVVAGLIIQRTSLVADAVLLWIDFFLCTIFLIDFFVSLWRAPSGADYILKEGGWLDLLGAIPVVPGLPWTAFLRLARLNRLLRIVQHLRGRDRGQVIEETRQAPAKTALLTMVMAAMMLMTAASLFVLRFEQGAPDANILTGADALWWAFGTITTVAYGDYVPVTFAGRITAMVLMTFGIGIAAVLTSVMASRLIGLQDDQEEIVETVRKENALIRAELAEIKDLLRQQGARDDDEA